VAVDIQTPQASEIENAGAYVNATLQVSVYIPGTGSGYLIQNMDGLYYPGNSSDLSVVIGASTGVGGTCSAFYNICLLDNGHPSVIVPITLGMVDTFIENIQGGDDAGFPGGNMVSSSNVNFYDQLQFVGSDGLTPVVITEVSPQAPEPATWGMLVVGLGLGLLRIKRRGH